jgi:hypothetical protein
MSAYVKYTFREFIHLDVATIVGALQHAYAFDGFQSQYTQQTKAWMQAIPQMQYSFAKLLEVRPKSVDWTILLEYPLYRLRRRIDVVILAESLIVIVECKGAKAFTAADCRQIEEYALDLRDFHAKSADRPIIAVLWSTEARRVEAAFAERAAPSRLSKVDPVVRVGAEGLQFFLAAKTVT